MQEEMEVKIRHYPEDKPDHMQTILFRKARVIGPKTCVARHSPGWLIAKVIYPAMLGRHQYKDSYFELENQTNGIDLIQYWGSWHWIDFGEISELLRMKDKEEESNTEEKKMSDHMWGIDSKGLEGSIC